MSTARLYPLGLLLATAFALTACSSSGDDLSAWMEQQRAAAQPSVVSVPAPQPHIPQAYQGLGAVSPFSSDKLTVLLRAETVSPAVSGLLAAEMRRRKDPLEAVPLDTITMVGLLRRGNETVALVQSEGLIHQVRRGNHLGQNFGRITAISETQITLREIAQDPAGEWVERTTTLQLQEGTGQ